MTEDVTGRRASAAELSDIKLANVHGGGLISADFEGDVRVRLNEYQPAPSVGFKPDGTPIR